MRRTLLHFASVAALVAFFLPAAGQADAPLNVAVDGNRYTADLELPGGIAAELTVSFEDVVGLTPASLNVSVDAISPLGSLLSGRLGGTASGIPPGFPMLVTIEPDPARGLSFSGTVSVELYTHNLEFLPESPLRLYSAPIGGTFRDITVMHGAGSYRSAGTKGNFSEFLIAIETRSPQVAAADKLGYLRNLLDGAAATMDSATYADLSGLLAAAETAFSSGAHVACVSYVEAFAEAVREHDEIPNVWSASHELPNIAGQLRAAAGTLRFSLTLAINRS